MEKGFYWVFCRDSDIFLLCWGWLSLLPACPRLAFHNACRVPFFGTALSIRDKWDLKNSVPLAQYSRNAQSLSDLSIKRICVP
jgi:hypothetical protein